MLKAQSAYEYSLKWARGGMVDAADLNNLSALAETRDVELLKVGEAFQMVIPSQAFWKRKEGVETRRAAPKT